MDLEERLEALEEAHRALAAQHTALMTVCQVMLPLISFDPSGIARRLLVAYDASNKEMETLGHDDEQQTEVRHWLDALSGVILAGEGKAPPPQSSGV